MKKINKNKHSRLHNLSPKYRKKQSSHKIEKNANNFYLEEQPEIESVKFQLLSFSEDDFSGFKSQNIIQKKQLSNKIASLVRTKKNEVSNFSKELANNAQIQEKQEFEAWHESSKPKTSYSHKRKYFISGNIEYNEKDTKFQVENPATNRKFRTMSNMYEGNKNQKSTKNKSVHQLSSIQYTELIKNIRKTYNLPLKKIQYYLQTNRTKQVQGIKNQIKLKNKGFVGKIVNIGMNFDHNKSQTQKNILHKKDQSPTEQRKNSLRKIIISQNKQMRSKLQKNYHKKFSSLCCRKSTTSQQYRSLSMSQQYIANYNDKNNHRQQISYQQKIQPIDNSCFLMSDTFIAEKKKIGMVGSAIKRKNKGKWVKPNIKSNISRVYDVQNASPLKNQINRILSLISQQKNFRQSVDL